MEDLEAAAGSQVYPKPKRVLLIVSDANCLIKRTAKLFTTYIDSLS